MITLGPVPSSEQTLEETLSKCVKSWTRQHPSTSHIVGDAANGFLSFESQDGDNEASPRDNCETGFKHIYTKVASEKMGPRQGAIGKHQHRRSSKGNHKVYHADATNFRALVYEHTCKLSSSTVSNCATPPASPLTPHSITSTSSPWEIMSQCTSPPTSNTTLSGPASPLSPPYQGLPNNSQQAYSSFHVNMNHTDSSHRSPHLEISNIHPFLSPIKCNHNLALNHTLTQTNYVPRSASTSCLSVLNGENVPCNSCPLPQGTRFPAFERALSMEKYLLEDDANYNANGLKGPNDVI